MIPMLSASAWREFRGEPPEKGLNRTTHLASIEDPTGKLHRCYVKGCPPNWMTPLTEAIGWLLAEALDLPRPEFAALVMVPLDRLREHMQLDQHWLNYPEMLAFCTSAVDGKSASHGWKWFAHLRKARVYKRPEVARISAFDCWVDNQDRNTGNLLIRPDGECVPIDNEFILYSQLWQGRVPFSVHYKSLLSESSQYLGEAAQLRFKVEMARSSKLHLDGLNKAAPKLQNALHALVPNTHSAAALWIGIHQYLSVRADPDWLGNQLGVIA